MGRAIVRQPQVFLMDEPLSNLDAKLRVQTRTQIAALQRRLGVTTVYVTHDQVEAMTMGDRVAVLKDGVLQQCASPRDLFKRPVNVFVAGFIGSPAMNLFDGQLDGDHVRFGALDVPVRPDQRAAATSPSVTIGVRPGGDGASSPTMVWRRRSTSSRSSARSRSSTATSRATTCRSSPAPRGSARRSRATGSCCARNPGRRTCSTRRPAPGSPIESVTQLRTDPFLGTKVHVVDGRQARPNMPSSGCPFCVGGLEAPEPYDVRSFPNRWPAMDGDRCEVVLYTPEHDATFWSLGPRARARSSTCGRSAPPPSVAATDVSYVQVFENRGAEVGATIAHPHGQIYAYDHVPFRPGARLDAGWRPESDPGGRAVAEHGGWRAWVPWAPMFPVELNLAPIERIPDLPQCGSSARDELAALLVDVLARLDRLFGQPLPYMMWLNQRPTVDAGYDDAWLNVEIVSPWRGPGVQRFIAAAEVGAQEYFNPVVPEQLAARLR